VHLAGLFQSPFDKLGVHEFADERGGDRFDLRSGNQIFYLPGDPLRRIKIHIGLAHQGIDDPLSIPAQHCLVRGADKEGHIGRFRFFFELLTILFHLDYGCHLISPFVLILR
jgi:hypothetical protein